MGVELKWLLQAGFLVSGPSGALAIDPYLSDLCERRYGLVRGPAAPYGAADLPASLVLVTHWHEDHFDVDSAPKLVERGVVFVGPPSCGLRFEGMGLPSANFISIDRGQSLRRGGITVTATPARHLVTGFLTEDAVGFVVEMDGVRVYHTGDTEYDRSLLTVGDQGRLSAALVCVNGTGGNMNPIEAAALVAQLKPDLAVPMHFGLWRSDTHDEVEHLTQAFASALVGLDDSIGIRVPTTTEAIILTPITGHAGKG
jgi:L-ascorbate metabolism protein UlaG (beta-lactamase superfamily)